MTEVVDHAGHRHRLVDVRRFSPLILLAVVAAAAVALLRSTDDNEPDGDWKPVQPK